MCLCDQYLIMILILTYLIRQKSYLSRFLKHVMSLWGNIRRFKKMHFCTQGEFRQIKVNFSQFLNFLSQLKLALAIANKLDSYQLCVPSWSLTYSFQISHSYCFLSITCQCGEHIINRLNDVNKSNNALQNRPVLLCRSLNDDL